jgi:hypothetical protein
MKSFRCTQYTPEWWEARCGIPTSSAFDRIITPAKGEKSKGARAYACQLAAELACYHPNFFTERENRPKSYAMANGTNLEPEARRFYEQDRGVDVEQIGFVLSSCGRYGCSPDGLVAVDDEGEGGLELKCPNPETHAGYLLDGILPLEYKPQVHGTLITTGRPWWDFMSYAPGFDPFLIRVRPDDYTRKVGEALAEFLDEYDAIVKALGLERQKAEANMRRRQLWEQLQPGAAREQEA